MNSKILSVLASAVALSITAALPAFSQSTNPTVPTQRQQMRRPDFLNLTPDQQARMEQIRQNQRSQIEAILTAEQKAQLQRNPAKGDLRGNRQNQGAPRTRENRGMPRTPFASLNLSAEQRSKIETVMRSSREQMDAVLTSQQRQQLQQHRQQHEQGRQASPQGTQNR
jgi:periplasmic protein CpxP/Spy